MNLLKLRLRYGFEMVNAYLAQMAGEKDLMDSHIAQAEKIGEEYALEVLNTERGLFD